MWWESNKIHSSHNKDKLFLISYGAFGAYGRRQLDVIFRKFFLAAESVKWKRFVRLKTPRQVNTEAPAYLSEEGIKIRDTLPDLKVRMEPWTVAFLHPEFDPPIKESMLLNFW